MSKCHICTRYVNCAEHSGRPLRKIIGVKISGDFGKTWTTRALCETCISNIEPSTMAKREIESGTLTCDWCIAINYMYPEMRLNAL